MGVIINATKPILIVDENSIDLSEEQYYNVKNITCENFYPFQHLTKFKQGYYICDEIDSRYISIPYTTYGYFRKMLCEISIGLDIEAVWEGLRECKYVDKPFIEIIWFTDSDGCFDYVIAEKLLDDFLTFKDKAYKFFSKLPNANFYNKIYNDYIDILQKGVQEKGVVRYN